MSGQAEHAAVLGGIALGVAGLIAARGWLRGRHDAPWRRAAAAVLLVNEAAAWVVAPLQGTVRIPLQLCDLALLLTVAALWRPRGWVVELAYFWALAGGVQAAVTPDLAARFPDYWWIKFHVTHSGMILAAVYLAVTGRVAPTHRSVWRVWGWSNLYVAAMLLVNARWGTNYGYLAAKPAQPSLLDHFGPWPQYILMMELIGLASFYLLYAPFGVARLRRAR